MKRSVEVTVEVSVKSQEPPLINESVSNLLTTSFEDMLGLTVKPPFPRVFPDNNAAEIISFLYSPAYVVVILVLVAIFYF